MHETEMDEPSGRLCLAALRDQLEVVERLSERVREQLEAERDRAAALGDRQAEKALQDGVLQVVRVRNDLCTARRDLSPLPRVPARAA
jgi:hypothetical protein